MSQKYRGSAKVTLRDHANWVFADSRNVLSQAGIGGMAMVVVFLFFNADILDHPVDGVMLIVGFVFVGAAGGIILVSFTIFFGMFLLLGRAQRDMIWEFDESGIGMTDGAGSQGRMPWAVIKGSSEKKAGFVIRFRPIGSRWIPKHAFDVEDIEGVRQLLQSNAGKQ